MTKVAIHMAYLCMLVIASLCVPLVGQNLTPNVGLQLPVYGQSGYYSIVNYDYLLLDRLLSGNVPVPAISIALSATAPPFSSTGDILWANAATGRPNVVLPSAGSYPFALLSSALFTTGYCAVFDSNGNINGTPCLGGGNVSGPSTTTVGHPSCWNNTSGTLLADCIFPSTQWAALQTGTNTTATMVVGTGASMTASGSGAIVATSVPASGVTGTLAVAKGGTGTTTNTGFGSVVLSSGPTLVNAVLGTPASGVLTNATGLPLTTGVVGILSVAKGGSGTASPAIVAGTNITVTGSWPNQTINASGSLGFSALTSGTNTTAAMLVGSGGSLGVTGSGTIVATSVPVAGVTSLTFTGNTTKAASSTGAITSGHCAQWDSNSNVVDAGAACGSGGSSAFNSLTSGTNTTASMVIGSGGSLSVTGSGTNAATSVPGGGITGSNSIPASTLPLATTGAFGAVKPDGTTITISAGVISAASGSFSPSPAIGANMLLTSDGAGATYGFNATGPSGALQIVSGQLDIVTSVVPTVAAPNTFTGVQTMQQLRLAPVAYASLPITCSGGTDGQLAYINDSPTQTWGAGVTVGGGSLRAALLCDGSVPGWTVFAK